MRCNDDINANSNERAQSKADQSRPINNIVYDPDDYLYRYFHATLLHDEICFSCEYRRHDCCTAPNSQCNYVPIIKKE